MSPDSPEPREPEAAVELPTEATVVVPPGSDRTEEVPIEPASAAAEASSTPLSPPPGDRRRRAIVASAAVVVVAIVAAVLVTRAGSDDHQTDTKRTTTTAELEETEGTESETLVDAERNLAAGSPYTSYTSVTDDSGTLRVRVPSRWSQVATQIDEDDGEQVPSIVASPDPKSFLEGWSAPGVTYFASARMFALGSDRAVAKLAIDAEAPKHCTAQPRKTFVRGGYRGTAQLWTRCGETGASLHILVVSMNRARYSLVLETQALTRADVQARRLVIESFGTVGDPTQVISPTTSTTATATETTPPSEPPAPESTTPPSPAPPPATAPPEPPDDQQQARAIQLVGDHVAACGMDWEDAAATKTGSMQWEVSVYILPPPPEEENGSPGEGVYLVDLDRNRVVSINGTANVLCPG